MIVYGDDICHWVQERMPEPSVGFDRPVGIGIIRDNVLVGGVVYDNYRPNIKSIYGSIAIDDKICLTKKNIITLLQYPFYMCGCNRVNVIILQSNAPSQALARRLGFTQEGVLRQASSTGEDMLLFGMLKSEFESKWLKS